LDELTEEDISSHSDNQTNSTSEDYLKAQLELVDEKLNQLDSLVSPISEASFDDLNDLLSSPQDNKNLSISSED
jgi:transcription termination factor NusB